jgi:hypothetical protein
MSTQQSGRLDAMQSSKGQGIVSARRRLIRGTFAVPAVLTLHTGSALAASSSLRCLSSTAQQPVPVVGITDTIVRIELWASSTGDKLYLKGADVHGIITDPTRVGVNGSFIKKKEWREVTVGSGTVTLGVASTTAPSGAVRGSKFIALRFAPGTSVPVQIVGVVDGTSTLGSAASLNCWLSFAATAG